MSNTITIYRCDIALIGEPTITGHGWAFSPCLHDFRMLPDLSLMRSLTVPFAVRVPDGARVVRRPNGEKLLWTAAEGVQCEEYAAFVAQHASTNTKGFAFADADETGSPAKGTVEENRLEITRNHPVAEIAA